MDGQPLKKFGSQGQQKSFLIALRLSQYDYLAKATKTKPMLLLDDVFDKLDDERIERLTDLLKRFGKIWSSIYHRCSKRKDIFAFERQVQC